MEPIAIVMKRLESFEHVKRRDETENIRALVEMIMEGKRSRGRPKLRWKYTVRTEGPGPSIGKGGKVSAYLTDQWSYL